MSRGLDSLCSTLWFCLLWKILLSKPLLSGNDLDYIWFYEPVANSHQAVTCRLTFTSYMSVGSVWPTYGLQEPFQKLGAFPRQGAGSKFNPAVVFRPLKTPRARSCTLQWDFFGCCAAREKNSHWLNVGGVYSTASFEMTAEMRGYNWWTDDAVQTLFSMFFGLVKCCKDNQLCTIGAVVVALC